VYLVQEWVVERVRDWQAAAEVVQRVLLRLATELAAGETDRGPYRIIVRSALSSRRSRTSSRLGVPSTTPREHLGAPASNDGDGLDSGQSPKEFKGFRRRPAA